MRQTDIGQIKNTGHNVLLHVCCAPCSGYIIETIIKSEIPLTLFFYNPNIYPVKEYEERKREIVTYAKKLGIPLVDADYDNDAWMQQTKGLENEPERGKRCSVCFDMRLERTAHYASENGFDLFATTLGMSRWKDLEQVNESGRKAASKYRVNFWDNNWRKCGGSERANNIAKQEGFYRQNYCGCVYSLNKSLEKKGIQ